MRIVVSGDLFNFFLEQIDLPAATHSLNPDQAVYLAKLLADRSTPQSGPTTLFDLYKQAVEEGGVKAISCYREMGDRSLFLVGVFPQYLNRRRGMGERYYCNMGQAAYANLATLLKDQRFKQLSLQFGNCVSAIRDTMGRVRWAEEDDANDLYEAWLLGESPMAEQRIQQLGLPLKKYFS